MLTTKKYEYLSIEKILVHPEIKNHRSLDIRKVAHYETDILKNGLLEPLIVWEKRNNEYYLVGGFHRLNAIHSIRKNNPGFFDRVDVRVVGGDFDEIRALNLKLNADRLDTKLVDFFETVIYLNNANWSKERIAGFLDRSLSWVEEIIRYVPGMDSRVKAELERGEISWSKAKIICKKIMDAPAGKEKETLDSELSSLKNSGERSRVNEKPLTFKAAKKNMENHIAKNPDTTFSIKGDVLLSLLLVLEGKKFEQSHLDVVKKNFPLFLN